MTDSETRTVLRSLVERRLTPSQSILFMAWLELMLETEGQTFVWAVQKWQMRMSRAATTPVINAAPTTDATKANDFP